MKPSDECFVIEALFYLYFFCIYIPFLLDGLDTALAVVLSYVPFLNQGATPLRRSDYTTAFFFWISV